MSSLETALQEKINKYFALTKEAYTLAQSAPSVPNVDGAHDDFLDMVQRYISDAEHFMQKGDLLNALAAISYAHGWLDAGARISLWKVTDSRLFTVDDTS